MDILIVVLCVYLVAVTAVLLYRSFRSEDMAAPLQRLSQAMQQEQMRSAVLSEKLERLDPIARMVGRISDDLTRVQTYVVARQDLERRTAESISRLEAIIAGTQTKGAAGENILEVVFSQLPAEWQLRDYRIGDKVVEFGLRLPNGLVMPIDSKWAATPLLERFLASDDLDEKRRLKTKIESEVLARAKEVRKYLDPNFTVNFGVAVVPDAVYDLCSGILAKALRFNVVLTSYSMFVPYLLLVFQTVLKTSRNIDLERLDTYLEVSQQNVEMLQEELEGRFSRAITMLGNSHNEMAACVSKVSGALNSMRVGAMAALEEEGASEGGQEGLS